MYHNFRLEDEQDILSDESSLENSLTLDNIFNRLEQFEVSFVLTIFHTYGYN